MHNCLMCNDHILCTRRNLEIAHDGLVICYNHKARAKETVPDEEAVRLWGVNFSTMHSTEWEYRGLCFFFSVDRLFSSPPNPSHRKLVHFVGWIRRGCISEITCRAATRRTRIHFAVLSNDLFFARTWLVLQVSTRAFLTDKCRVGDVLPFDA